MRLPYDLHLHSCLSPCADREMTPANIAAMCALKGLRLIALTDHNSAKNCPAFLECAAQYEGLTALPGMELCTEEEIHAICLFPTLERALAFDAFIYGLLPPIQNREDIFGTQIIVDANERILAHEERLLINAAAISFEEAYAQTLAHGGILFPAHIDRPANGLLSQLGFIPPDSRFACAEVHRLEKAPAILEANPILRERCILTNSDAHTLGDIHEPTQFLEVPSCDPFAVLKALDPLFQGYMQKGTPWISPLS